MPKAAFHVATRPDKGNPRRSPRASTMLPFAFHRGSPFLGLRDGQPVAARGLSAGGSAGARASRNAGGDPGLVFRAALFLDPR